MNFKYIYVTLFFLFTLFVGAQPPNIVWIVSEDNSKHYIKLFDEHGVDTPNIEKLAQQGIQFNRAFSNAAVCSAARSTLITSSYGPKLATHYHRAEGKITLAKNQDMFPTYLKRAGYYTVNNAKEDYNIKKPAHVWDESSKKATYKNRSPGQPFFYVHNIQTTHEGQLHFSKEIMNSTKTKENPDAVFVQPNHPNTSVFQYSNAYYRDKIVEMDKEVGKVINQLKKDNLLESTIIFYYGDHGGVLPDSKGYLKETGLHVPLVVYIPEKYKNLTAFEPGSKTNAFVSFVDFGATVLNLAEIKIPETMDGNPFLGKNITIKDLENRDETFGFADRFDEKYDMVRSLRKGDMKYIRNFTPFNIDGLMNNYRYKQLVYQEWLDLFKTKKLNAIQSQFFEPKAPEALYDLEKDPFETENLVNNPAYHSQLISLRKKLNTWMEKLPDLSLYPEFYILENAIQNPVNFGSTHKMEIKKYLEIANLSLLEFEKATPILLKYLKSTDDWQRYWALITCSSFGKKAKIFHSEIENIMTSDSQLLNKMRAAEYLGITGIKNTSQELVEILYQSKKPTEALLILNAIVLQRDFYQHYSYPIDNTKLSKRVYNNGLIKERLTYLNNEITN
ncbi:arylsulfatase A family protein [Galbibacter orientalis DSM 19592]|uniref:Arylsulfatase A family protein n=1 Tax=Galbibacter orientalis DSM 19592 TaxID=926559 RepID=I3CAX6_9FLAO|nr:sulfatase [Galbibacter orientalis]EIJ40769.1 arylsulfatase A family protein [Galbibacter orientalis DSM 19592]